MARRQQVALLVLLNLVVLAACGSTTTPVIPSFSAVPSASPSAAPATSSAPDATDSTDSTSTPSAGDSFAPLPLASAPVALAMPEFVAYEPISVRGTDFQAFVDTPLSCDALAGWMTAGDWRLDDKALSAQASSEPDSGATIFPRILWLALSWGQEAAIVSLAPKSPEADANSGCEGRISRLSRAQLQATGPFQADTSALTYQYGCTPLSQSVTVGEFIFGDDGSRVVMSAEIPLSLGDQALLDGKFYAGANALSPSTVVAGLADGDISLAGLDKILGGLATYAPTAPSFGTATVTSIDPFEATVTLAGYKDPSGTSETLSTTVRCDMSDNALTQAAASPAPVVSPTPGPPGHMEISIGSGTTGLSRTFDGSGVTCSHVTFGDSPTWDLQYNGGDGGLFMDLTIQQSGESALLLSEGDTYIQIEKARVGGDLHTTVSDGGTTVEFNATGTTPDGRATTITATCAAISRL